MMCTVQLKRYVLYCLWAFLLPQFSNVLHFVIVPHEVSNKQKQTLYVTKAKKGHNCEQHWFETPTLLQPFFALENKNSPTDILYKGVVVKERCLTVFDFTRFLRGPPKEYVF